MTSDKPSLNCFCLQVCKAPLPRDVESLQQLIVAHKEFEGAVQGHEPEIDQVKNLFNAIPQKTPKEQAKLDKVRNRHCFLNIPSSQVIPQNSMKSKKM